MELRKVRQRSNFEEQMMRRRDRDQRHADTWGGHARYFERVEKQNTKFDEWTSPRYYDSNNELVASVKKERDRAELLEKRRENLRKLLLEDERTFEIELIRMKKPSRVEVPVEVLREVNDGFKVREEERRRNEAEQKLYRQWRSNNPVLKAEASQRQTKELKMSWLDQQIEKRMAKEKEAEETKKLIKERELYIDEQKLKEEELKTIVEEKNKALLEELRQQIQAIEVRDEEAKQLRLEEANGLQRQVEVAELQEKWQQELKRREAREVALYNLKQHRRKLEARSKNIAEELEAENVLIETIKQAQILEAINDNLKRQELKRSMHEFAKLVQDLKELELKRKNHLLFTFDSEAKCIYEKFDEIWRKEQAMRSSLVQEVLKELQEQIERNVERNKERQRANLRDKEEMLQKVEDYQKEIEDLHEFEEKQREEYRKDLDKQVKENRTRKKRLENLEKKRTDDEIENLRSEEERLKREIRNVQLGKPCMTYGRRRFFY